MIMIWEDEIQHAKYDYVRKRCIRRLSEEDQKLINTYEAFEKPLMERAQSVEELLDLMQVKRPFLMTARALCLSESDVFSRTQRLNILIESAVSREIDQLEMIPPLKVVQANNRTQQAHTKIFLLKSASHLNRELTQNKKGEIQ
ncbi:hypothetical protein GCM10012290_01490 [Halolactibacillus alkaliphilus]|uniref:Uncharacterized protein n=1 Tax=Halolactibacillus alkaliphilus TaxID=442899 RepID=A0A511X0K8_9BACI|nr:DUF2277 domain-containing protein [Halolactibacillus alkaliphilus]GEN56483.1 hypothetical protein HAL01_09470 [Halolactibacillus alkaliphilus]GGN64228.1 hypothetical protein GCM10012290_01490 [Halolactibacillus alkaliphilus]SFO61600.1 hypothetical protein SAMN05720591_10185 [Halolactibacillus alkaliphilus]